MGILNHTSDGLYSMVAVLYRTLARLGPTRRDELIALCTAGIASQHSGPKVNDALRRWEQLGLFEERDDKIGIAAPPPEAACLDDLTLTEQLRCSVLLIAFTPANVSDLWGTEGSADLSRGLAWWMAQDCWNVDTQVQSLLKLETDQVPEPTLRIVNNDVRMARLREWAAFLGFAWTMAPRRLEFDPSAAIRRMLDIVLPEAGAKLPAEEFLHRLAQVLPVLDGGTYRVAVEERLNPAVWSTTRAGWVSATLGRALRRLSETALQLERRADAHSSIKIPDSRGSGAPPWLEFTHVSRSESRA